MLHSSISVSGAGWFDMTLTLRSGTCAEQSPVDSLAKKHINSKTSIMGKGSLGSAVESLRSFLTYPQNIISRSLFWWPPNVRNGRGFRCLATLTSAVRFCFLSNTRAAKALCAGDADDVSLISTRCCLSQARALRLIADLRHRKPREVMVCTERIASGGESSFIVQDFYSCEICGKRFTAPNSLYGHYRGHAGKFIDVSISFFFKCARCGRRHDASCDDVIILKCCGDSSQRSLSRSSNQARFRFGGKLHF